MEKRIITISREFGSGGRTIGKLVAEHLGIQCYDAELIQKLAAESGFGESDGSCIRGKWFGFFVFFGNENNGSSHKIVLKKHRLSA